MDVHGEFFHQLDHDMTSKILSYLDDPGDIVRAGSVSRSWQAFIISSGISKQLCVRLFPQLSSVACITDTRSKAEKPPDVGCSSTNGWELAKMEHKAYSLLARNLLSFETSGCISTAIGASSTDNYPEESIRNTLDPRGQIGPRASYWSSSGQKNPEVPEKLTYKLISDLCLVTEINVHPFQAYFQPNFPIYSARAVRFRMGHQILPNDVECHIPDSKRSHCADDNFVWTYTSPEFPMAQENSLQNFKLPEPVLCIGGILQIELLGRVQQQEMDSMYYICVTHVQVLGCSLSPMFSTEILEPSGKFALRYNPQAKSCTPSPPKVTEETILTSLSPEMLRRHARGWEQLLNMLRGNLGLEVYVSDDEHHESDEEFAEEYAPY